MGGTKMSFLLIFLTIGMVSARAVDKWNIETICPLIGRPTYLPHPLHCNLYLFCTGNSVAPFLNRCPKDQLFDLKLRTCVESSQATCNTKINRSGAQLIAIEDKAARDLLCDKSGYVSYKPHPTDCSKFYECSVGQLIEMECPPGLSFIPHLELCGRSRLTCGNHTQRHGGKKECRKLDNPVCPTINMGYSVRLPHRDCSSFYQCMNGAPVTMRCPPGLHFNSIKQECDLPARSECMKCDTSDIKEKIISKEEFVSCPKHYGFQENINHPKHCDRFYSCASGYPTERRCPLLLQFNPVTQKCDWSASVKCANKTVDQLQEQGNFNANLLECETYEKCEHGSLMPNPSDCNSFYACVWGQPVLMKCPAHLFFNPDLQVCDWNWNVECEDDSSSSSSDSSSSSSSSEEDYDTYNDNTSPEYGMVDLGEEMEENDEQDVKVSESSSKVRDIKKEAQCLDVEKRSLVDCEMPKCPPYNYGLVVQFYNPFNCSEFFKCNWGVPIKFSCPSELIYNRRLQVCDYHYSFSCTPCSDADLKQNVEEQEVALSLNPNDACESGFTNLPDPNECGSYYSCKNGKMVKQSCPKGLHYNPVLNVCDFPHEAGCGLYQKSPGSSCPELNTKVCSLGREGTFVNPKDCSSYYQCNNGTLLLKNCPFGLEFNAESKVCDNPKNSMCKPCVEGRVKRSECLSSIYGLSATLSDPNNCSGYYRCEWGAMVPYKCPDGLHFNSILEVCDLPERSGCEK